MHAADLDQIASVVSWESARPLLGDTRRLTARAELERHKRIAQFLRPAALVAIQRLEDHTLPFLTASEEMALDRGEYHLPRRKRLPQFSLDGENAAELLAWHMALWILDLSEEHGGRGARRKTTERAMPEMALRIVLLLRGYLRVALQLISEDTLPPLHDDAQRDLDRAFPPGPCAAA